jgi:hypothetical protein
VHLLSENHAPTRQSFASGSKFPKYILTKAKLLTGGEKEALAIGALYQPKAIKGAVGVK